MAKLELQAGALGRAGDRPKRVTSPHLARAKRAPRGGSPVSAPAASGALARSLERARGSVWLPVAAKAAGILGGMLALAAIGASSIAHGSGVPADAAAVRGAFVAGGLGPLTPAPGGAQIGGLAGPGASRAADAAPVRASSSAPAAPESPPSPGRTADGKVILNKASADDFRRLPGVGPKRAEAIVLLRQKLGGRFKRVTDLLRVKGIGPKGLRKIAPLVVLDAS